MNIMLAGEAWGENEEAQKFPFVGTSGITLIDLLSQVELITLSHEDRANRAEFWKTRNPFFTRLIWEAHPEIGLTNVFNLRPKPTNDIKNLCGPKKEGIPKMPPLQAGKYVLAQYQSELDRFISEIKAAAPTIVVALGATPAWALLHTTGIKAIRGAPVWSDVAGVKVMPTYHPAAVMRDWSLRPIVIADLNKAARESTFPEVRRPHRKIWIEPNLDDMTRFEQEHILPASQLSIDIETIGDMITCIGFSPTVASAIVIPFFDPSKPGKNYWPSLIDELSAWFMVKQWCGLNKRIVFQNGIFDMNFLWKTMGITVPHAAEDTMLLHHALQPEMEKGLGFLGTIYTQEAAWKVMRKTETVKREN